MKNKLLLLNKAAIFQARRSFWAYRQYLNPDIKKGWWQKDAAHKLQQFYDDLVSGKRPKLVIEAPPQHGKSRMIVEFVTWLAGNHPSTKTIYTSVSERLGIRANKMCQRIYDTDRYKSCFPDTRINSTRSVSTAENYMRNSEMIEYIGEDGYFRNTTIRGSIVGESLDLGIIDDPIKGREAAGSITVRNSTWDWLTDDFFTRFSEDAGMLCILTRWHVDDPVGRLKEKLGDDLRVVTYKAIAEVDDEHRNKGEALFPEHKSLEFLNNLKSTMRAENWESLYQQSPVIAGGNMVKLDWFKRYNTPPTDCRIILSFDTAQKAAQINDASVCVAWAIAEGGYYVIDVVTMRVQYPDLKRNTISLAEKYNPDTVLIEDKSSGSSLIQDLRNETVLPIIPINPTSDKITRMSTCLASVEAGNVYLPHKAEWLYDFESELVGFPAVAHDDRCDAFSQFLNWIREQNSPVFIGR